MASQPTRFLTPQEYLALDDAAERPSEYWGGIVVEIEGASSNHGLLHSNLSYCLGDSTRKSNSPCVVRVQVRVHIPATGLYAYPDLTVTCGGAQHSDKNSLLNPVLLIEILSPNTEDYDCGRKFEAYRSIPSLKEYVTVAQDRVKIDHWVVINGKWTLDDTYSNIEATGAFLEWPIQIREIYRGVEFEHS